MPKFYGYESQLSSFLEKNHDFTSIVYNESDLVSRGKIFSIFLAFIEILIFIFGPKRVLLNFFGLINNYRKDYRPLNSFLTNKISKSNSINYSRVIIFKGAGISTSTLKLIKSKTKLIYLYLWDSEIIYPEIQQTLKYSNKIFTYDIEDALMNSWIYKPMFYEKTTNEISNNIESYFCSYIAKFGFYRFLFCFMLVLKNTSKKFYFYFKFPINIHFNFFSSEFFLKKSSLNFDEVSKIYNDSKYLLSISEFSKGGFTQRIYDSFCFKKKCIVNHKNINWDKDTLDNIINYRKLKLDNGKFTNKGSQFFENKKIQFWILDFLDQT